MPKNFWMDKIKQPNLGKSVAQAGAKSALATAKVKKLKPTAPPGLAVKATKVGLKKPASVI